MAAIIRCKMCGGDLALVEGSSIATCEYCGTTQTVPNQDNTFTGNCITRDFNIGSLIEKRVYHGDHQM